MEAAETNTLCPFVLVQNRNEAEWLFSADGNFSSKKPGKVVVLAQTTFDPVEFQNIADIISKNTNDCIVENTICSATVERRIALKELSKMVNGILVIGGKNSANSKRLFEEAQKLSSMVAFVETQADIPASFYSLPVVGLTAGASTPDEIIDEVEYDLLEKANSTNKSCNK